MKMKTIQPYSDQICLKSLDYLQIDLAVKNTSAPIPLKCLFETAIRKNKKRTFLFVSKILGKHLAVHPKIPLLGGIMLAYQYAGFSLKEPIRLLEQEEMDEAAFERLRGKKVKIQHATLMIGFAETATGLGHSMFSACEGNISYIHTTRERISSEQPVFTFEEVHSHATGHRCYAEDKNYFDPFQRIILVDDEITTGHTALHLIEALHQQSSYCKCYDVVSLMDWRNSKEQEEAAILAERLGIQLRFISLVQGEMSAHLLKPIPEEMLTLPKPIALDFRKDGKEVNAISIGIDGLMEKQTRAGDGKVRTLAYMKANGRFGLSALNNKHYEQKLKEAGKKLAELRTYESCLVIGTEEFIYIPCLLASCLGKGVRYQSSTRSPIIPQKVPGYPIQTALAYKRPEDESVMNYLYNMMPGRYDEVFWIMERGVSQQFMQAMMDEFYKRGFKKLTFVSCDGRV